MDQNPFILLKNTVNVLVVDDMPAITGIVKWFLELFDIYTVYIANSTREAMNVIEKAEKRINVCLFDLGMGDIAGNEFYLLDTYQNIMPFVVMTSCEDREKAFACHRRGAKAYVGKTTPTSFNFHSLVTSVNRYALLNMLCPEYNENSQDNISKYVEALIRKAPKQILDWARVLNISDRQVRYVWEERLGYNSKHTLCVYHLFSSLFEQINTVCKNNGFLENDSLTDSSPFVIESKDYSRWLDYYFLNIRDINAYISALHVPLGQGRPKS